MSNTELRDEAGFMGTQDTQGTAGAVTGAMGGYPQQIASPSALDYIREAMADQYAVRKWRLGDLEDRYTARDIRTNILAIARINAQKHNTARSAGSDPIKIPQQLPVEIACEMMQKTGDVAVLVAEKDKAGTLVYYDRTGDHAGVWKASPSKRLMKILGSLDVQMPQRQYAEPELLANLDEIFESQDNKLVPMKNGVVDISEPGRPEFTPYLTDTGEPNPYYEDLYGREAHFMHKNAANWDPSATNIVLYCHDGTPWSVDDHLDMVLAGSEAATKVWWQSCNFVLRGMSGGRTMWYVDSSENGQGGGAKSTTALMIGALVGEAAVLNINMDDMQKQFGLANLVGKRLLIGNETNAGTKGIEGTDVIKKIARSETVTVERKHKDGFEYKPRALAIQCMNTRTPKIKEKDVAFYRKVVILDFPATLTGGVQHDEIHDTFVYDQRVIDYIAYRALTMGPIDQYDPEAVAILRKGVDEIRTATSTVFQFMQEFQNLANNKIPVEIVYDCYKGWCTVNGFGGTNITNFESDLRNWTGMNGKWVFRHYRSEDGKSAQRIPRGFLPEEVVAQFGSSRIRDAQARMSQTVEGGGGRLSADIMKRQYRKWLERVDPAESAQDAARRDLQRYTEFRIAYCHMYAKLIQEGKAALPSPEDWCALGQPMPYYGQIDTSKPLDHTNYGLRGFRAVIGGTDYGTRLYARVGIPERYLAEAEYRDRIRTGDGAAYAAVRGRLLGKDPYEDKNASAGM